MGRPGRLSCPATTRSPGTSERVAIAMPAVFLRSGSAQGSLRRPVVRLPGPPGFRPRRNRRRGDEAAGGSPAHRPCHPWWLHRHRLARETVASPSTRRVGAWTSRAPVGLEAASRGCGRAQRTRGAAGCAGHHCPEAQRGAERSEGPKDQWCQPPLCPFPPGSDVPRPERKRRSGTVPQAAHSLCAQAGDSTSVTRSVAQPACATPCHRTNGLCTTCGAPGTVVQAPLHPWKGVLHAR